MKKLLQLHFKFNGPFGDEMSQAMVDIANSINDEPGFIWKIWTENEETKEGGGIYLFESEETALAYLKMHTARLSKFGVGDVFSKIFNVNDVLTHVNGGLHRSV